MGDPASDRARAADCIGWGPKGQQFPLHQRTLCRDQGYSVAFSYSQNPSICDIYAEHSTATTVAKHSPSGFYICSADCSGKIRIWDTVNREHVLKNEFQPFIGTIKDLAWSPDNQRIVVVGEGRERFGHVIAAETGTSVGEIGGHSGTINSVDFRPSRPFRILTGSEDNMANIYEGPPFKYKTSLQHHSKYVQSVRYSRNGKLFATGGFDGKIFIYNADTYELIGECGSPAHKGGVYGVSWSPDGSQLLSSSGDKSCKIWDVESLKAVTQFVMGTDVLDQQVSCLWQDEHLLSVGLSGFISYLDKNNPAKPLRVLKGHNKPITAMTVSEDKSKIYTGSHDGFVTRWQLATGEQDRVKGQCHTSQVQDMCVSPDSIYTCGFDDTLRKIDPVADEYALWTVSAESQPRGISTDGRLIAVAEHQDIAIIEGESKKIVHPIKYEASCISIHPEGSHVAVGSCSDNKVHVYAITPNELDERATMEHRAAITDIKYSPQGNLLAACDGNRMIRLYSVQDSYAPAHDLDWCFHTAKVNCLAWAPNSLFLASGSLDTSLIIWSVENPMKHLILKKAHPQAQITKVAWIDNRTIVSTGQDSNVKLWDIQL
ncbi:actin-interacting protein 1-like isoform X2 [Varroa destructor]|uniref:Actin-interacting protein 1 n=1 Tax=Varroa destructor TaxID=109461 RepID=A0A7M7MHZ5_VARDE|nr:actin-interacting protein 1-like isoform X2 [Varroa destructor]XP_022664894.1 actin-interacting protein 1-like isoform X2 [Varroa destructor]